MKKRRKNARWVRIDVVCCNCDKSHRMLAFVLPGKFPGDGRHVLAMHLPDGWFSLEAQENGELLALCSVECVESWWKG